MRTGTSSAVFCSVLLAVASVRAAAGDLRLVDAVKHGDVAAARNLLARGVDPNTAEADGSTALHWAANRDAADLAALLIQSGARVNAFTDYGVTPLSLACSNANAVIVNMLLTGGADANAVTSAGETALMTAARSGSVAAVRALVDAGAALNRAEPWRGQTALMWAAAHRHAGVARLLVERGADVHARSRTGFTPLLFAAQQGDPDIVRLLVAAGASVNEKAADGSGALLVATVSGHMALASQLLDAGADPNAQDAGYTALHWAAGSWETRLTGVSGVGVDDEAYKFTAGLPSGKHGLVKILLAHGANPNARIVKEPPRFGFTLFQSSALVRGLAGATPFWLASMNGDVTLMRMLLASGADPSLGTKENTTPLMAAAGLAWATEESHVSERDALEAVKLVLELGADVNAVNDAGQTAVHGAALRGANSIIQLLVDKGASVNVANKRGYTPLRIAEGDTGGLIRGAFQSTVDLLRKLGAERTASITPR